jgi:PAS domain S-box-containing protein
MKPARDLSIRQQVTRTALLTCLAVTVLACTVFAVYNLIGYHCSLATELAAAAVISESNTTSSVSSRDAQSSHKALSLLSGHPHIVEACIYNRDGSVLAKYSRDGRDSEFIPPSLGPGGTNATAGFTFLFQPMLLDGKQVGTIYLRSDLAELYARTQLFAELILLLVLVFLAMAYMLASRLQRVISEPILDLARASSAVSLGNGYSLQAPKRSTAEIGSLINTFNEMMNRIHARVDERTRESQKEVAERKQAERQLGERTKFLNSLIENTPVGIVAIGADDAIQMCNPAFEDLFAYRQEDILGRPLPELLTNSETSDGMDSNRARLRQGKTTHIVTRRMRSDGSLVDVEAYSVPLGEEGNFTGAVLLYQDITTRKQAEAALLQAKEDAEAANRAKSEFLANMSHEIRTPMNGIMGMTDLALETELTSEQREYLETVKLSADLLLSLINDILDFSKIEAGKVDLEISDFNLRDTLEVTLKTLALRADEKGLELLCEMAPEVPEVVRGDSNRLRQVVINLIGNAIKFTQVGEVGLNVKVEAEDGGNRLLHFTVSDSGIGIPLEKQQSIFQPFVQADTSTTRKYGGTGLGLTISTRLVELMGGKMWVESEVGKGTQFHFTVRLETSEKPVEVGTIAPAELLRDVKALIVDDNRTNRRILEGMMKRWEMKLTSVEDGEEALAQLSSARSQGVPYALILTDMHMPNMDGFTLIERIRQRPELNTATIMMLTSAGHRGDGARCQELGVAAYLLKPIRQSELREAIARVLGAREQKGAIPLVTRYSLQDARDPETSLRVLVAEDNLVNQLLVTRLLEKKGHRVVMTSNGREALEALEKESFDLVLMDVQMPEMDGLEATAALRQKEKLKGDGIHQHVVALTAHAMKGDRERCLAAGMDAYLVKPIQPLELNKLLEDYGAPRMKEQIKIETTH